MSSRLPPAPAPGGEPDGPRPAVLVVDDRPENLTLAAGVLAELSHPVVAVGSGDEALRCLIKQDFAVILLDVNMPGLDGYALARMIRQRKRSAATPIIFLTAEARTEVSVSRGYALGAVDYIFRPLEPEILKAKVSVFLELHRRREQAERRGDDVEDELRQLLNRLEVGIFRLGLDGRLRSSNPACHRLIGPLPEDPAAGGAHILSRLGAEIAALCASLRQTSGRSRRELRISTAPGEPDRWLSVSLLLRGELGREGIEGMVEDVTTRKLAELELTQVNEELERRVLSRTLALQQVNDELQMLTHGVSHDLRAPLRHILALAAMIREDAADLPPHVSDHLGALTTAASDFKNLFDGLLAFFVLGQRPVDKKEVDQGALIGDVVCQVMRSAPERRVEWRIAALPPVQADPLLLRQVWMNLIENALKYSAKVPLAVIEVGCLPAPDEIVVYVRDNGAGFSADQGHRLFRVFQRLHHRDDFEGSGIGLANVAKIVGRHQGRVWAEGVPDRGATFFVALPKGERAPAPA